MCRKQSDEAAFVYKPLGVLKRSRVQRPTCGNTNTLVMTGALHNSTQACRHTLVYRSLLGPVFASHALPFIQLLHTNTGGDAFISV